MSMSFNLRDFYKLFHMLEVFLSIKFLSSVSFKTLAFS